MNATFFLMAMYFHYIPISQFKLEVDVAVEMNSYGPALC